MIDFFKNTTGNIWSSTTGNIWYGLTETIDDTVYRLASRRYYFTLTGAAGGTDDIEIPISSVQARRRNGTPSYLAVTIPDISKYNEVLLRPNGDLVVEMSYWYNGLDNFRTEIARALLEDVRLDQGGTSSTITLSGHSELTTVPKNIMTAGKSTYRRISSGKINHRMAEPEIFLNPGDTITVGTDTFVVGLVSYIISSMQQTMEITEAD